MTAPHREVWSDNELADRAAADRMEAWLRDQPGGADQCTPGPWLSTLTERIADAIEEAFESGVKSGERRGPAELADAVMEELGLANTHWIAMRTVDSPLFGAHRWHSCPSCGHTAETTS